MTPHEKYVLILIGCGLVVFAGGLVAGCCVGPWWLIHWAHMARFDDYADRDYAEGWDDARSAARPELAAPDLHLHHAAGAGHSGVMQLPENRCAEGTHPDRSALPLDVARSQGGVPGVPHGDWRAEYDEQLAPAALDAANLPGPVAPNLPQYRVGEIHRRAIVDLGQPGDDKMLTRDWFNRRAFIESLSNEWGGFEITDRGHLVAVAA